MAKSKGSTWATVQKLAARLPGAEESTSYGTPAFKVKGKLFVRFHDDGENLVVKIDESDRAMRLRADPEVFHLTDHYVAYPWVLVRLSVIEEEDLSELLEDAWRMVATKRLIDEKDRG